MQPTYQLRDLLKRFFSAKAFKEKPISLPKNLKKPEELIKKYLDKGEKALLSQNLKALHYFEAAYQVDATSAETWYQLATSFIRCGEEEMSLLLLASKLLKTAVQINPAFFEAWKAWGDLLFKLGKNEEESFYFTQAQEKWKKALSLSPSLSRPQLYWDLGKVSIEIYYFSGEAIELRNGINWLKKGEPFFKTDALFHSDMGNAYLEMGTLINNSRLFTRAIHYFDQAIEKNPLSLEGRVGKAHSYAELYINTADESFFSQAEKELAQATKDSPDDPDLWLLWAELLAESGKTHKDPQKLKRSVEKAAQCCQIEKNNLLAIGQWAESLALLGAFTGQAKLIRQAEKKMSRLIDKYPENVDLYYSYGCCLAAYGHYFNDPDYWDLAIGQFQQGLSLDRTHPELWQGLALAYRHIGDITEETEDYEKSIRFYTRAIDLKLHCPSLSFEYAQTLFRSSVIDENLERLEKALSELRQLIDTHKNSLMYHPDWLFTYGVALDLYGTITEQDSYYLEAIRSFSYLLSIDPEYPKVHFHIALAQTHLADSSSQKEDFEKAFYHFKQALKKDRENENIWLEWGLSLIQLANQLFSPEMANHLYHKAEQKLLKAGHLGHLDAYFYLACLYSIIKRYDLALSYLEKGYKNDTLPPLEELLEEEWLDNLHGSPYFSQLLSKLENRQKTPD